MAKKTLSRPVKMVKCRGGIQKSSYRRPVIVQFSSSPIKPSQGPSQDEPVLETPEVDYDIPDFLFDEESMYSI